MSITPKNWDSFQHYKDRAPSWIKLHKGLLTDFAFSRLPVASRALAPCIWLLASESADGSLPDDYDWLSFRLHQPRDEVVQGVEGLISRGFLIRVDGALADCKQDARPEGEEETQEQKQEREIEIILAAYHAALPKCRRAAVLPDARKRKLRAAIVMAKQACLRHGSTYDPHTFWPAYFAECAKDPWLAGEKANPKNPKWKQHLGVLIDDTRFVSIMDAALEAA